MKMLSKPINEMSNNFYSYIRIIKNACNILLPALVLCTVSHRAFTQTASAKVEVPDWALPGSATHKQVPPPLDFHRAVRTSNIRIGIFEGQSDVGAALVPGSSTYNAATRQYTIISAGYNVWYTRDEFRYLWKKMSGDISLAANVGFPVVQQPPHDRKVVLVIRQDLDDNAKEIMVAEHGSGMVHLAARPDKNEM